MKRDRIPELSGAAGLDAAVPVTIAHGDGIGPEIMAATLRVLAAAGARIAPEPIDIGQKVYLQGHSAGIAPEAWASLRRTRVFLKAPVTTPTGGGFKSLNVTIRKTLGLYANVRPSISYEPFVRSHAGPMDVVIVRENEEDLYAGIEHRQTDDVVQCLKLITRPGCERIVRYAFEYARANGRRKVTCMVKDNIMKLTDGLFYDVFQQIGAQYADIEKERFIIDIDIGAARLATRPTHFDVIVTPNLYGDILSDVAAEISGSVGLAGSANVGEHVSMFEAIHGSAPDIAGQDIANPSGLLLAAVMMLAHIGQPEAAARIHNAWLATIEDGVHTADVAGSRTHQKAGTNAFADAVIQRLGREPRSFRPAVYQSASAGEKRLQLQPEAQKPAADKVLVGVDVFLHSREATAAVAAALQAASLPSLSLQMITNRGVKVWPGGFPETTCTDHWRCRFMAPSQGTSVSAPEIIRQLGALVASGLDVIKTENLYTFDGKPGYALGQGQ